MSSATHVGIIVLNYNGGHRLLSCLRSLERLDYPHKEIFVIDNDSGDDSLALAEARFPHVVFLHNKKNEGFSKGMNQGMRLALKRGAEWAWIFNNDAEADPQALSSLMSVARSDPRAGLISPTIYETTTKRLWFAKGKLDFFRMRAVHIPPTAKELASVAYPSEFLTGCALLIGKKTIDAIGYLDERFFLYYEDADYSLRAASAGFSCLVVPEAKVFHSEESRSRPKKTYFLVYSGLLFFKKYASPLMRPYLAAYVTMRRVKNFIDRAHAGNSSALEAYRAYQDYFHER